MGWSRNPGRQPPAASASGPPGAAPAAPRAQPADLYARWALATGWRSFGRVRRRGACMPETIRIIARARDHATVLAAARVFEVPGVYLEAVPGTDRGACHFTATVRREQFATLLENRLGLTWELAAALREPLSTAQAESSGWYGSQRAEAALAAPAVLRRPAEPFRAAAPGLAGDCIAVIDFGCPFANLRFSATERAADGRDVVRPRVVAVWDQDASRAIAGAMPPWWAQPPRLGYGRELGPEAIAHVFRQVHDLDAPLDEQAVYRDLDYLVAYDDARRRAWYASHGSHVLDVAGGRRDPLLRAADLPEAEDDASRADLVFVQLPALTAADSSGGSLAAHLLDAVRYVLDRCAAHAKLVVNISYGTFAGPHDGSSLVERALDELLALRGTDFAVVLGAGNARRAGCHARRIVRRNRSALLRIDLSSDDTTDTFVEIWYSRCRSVPLRVRVRSSERDWSEWVDEGGRDTLSDAATGEIVAMLQHEREVPHGDGAMILLAVAPTALGVDDDGPLARPGRWEIEVCGDCDAAEFEVAIEAWIERDDPGDAGAGWQTRFASTEREDERNTLSSIATGIHTIVAGGFRIGDGRAAPYSSRPGAPRRPWQVPLVYAACEEDAETPSIAAAAVRSNDVYRMNGTSVAAPALARRLFNQLAGAREPIARRCVSPAPDEVWEDDWKAVVEDLARRPQSLVKLRCDD